MTFDTSPISYCPQFYSPSEYLAVLKAEETENLNELTKLQKEFPENIAIQIELAFAHLQHRNEGQFNKIIADLYIKHPNDILVKINYFNHFTRADSDHKRKIKFERIFQKELQSILHGEPYPTEVADEHYLLLLNTFLNFYIETNDDHKYTIYSHLRDFGFKEMIIDASYSIKGRERPIDSFLFDNFDALWVLPLIEHLENYINDTRPRYKIFYLALNIPIHRLSDDMIAELENLDNPEYIAYDLYWLLYQSFVRCRNTNGDMQPESINLFLYLLAHYKCWDLLPILYTVLSDMDEHALDVILGDLNFHLWHLPLQFIFSENTDGLYEFLTREENGNIWKLKSILIYSLCSVYNEAQNPLIAEMIKNLYNHYISHDNYMLPWLLDAFNQFKILDYKEKSIDAYNRGLIDTNVFPKTAKEFFDTSDAFYKTELFKKEKSLKGYYKIYCESINQSSSSEKMSVEESIEHYIEHAEQIAYAHQSIEDFDTYSYDESDIHPNVRGEYFERNENIIPIRSGPKVGRNDPCPCGSEKKYKKCCWNK